MSEKRKTSPEQEVARLKQRIATLKQAMERYVDRCPMCNSGTDCQDDLCYLFRKVLAGRR